MPRRHTPETFWRWVDQSAGPDGCWPWEGTLNVRTGYGQVSYQGRFRKAHQVAFELTKGPMPAGLEPDHLCRNRPCCNPGHLEAVTHAVNVRRAFDAKTHCRNGHAYAEHGFLDDAASARRCRTCRNEQSRLRKWNARSQHGPLVGTANHKAKLTPDVVRAIRASADTPTELGRRHGVSRQSIDSILSGETWQHVI